MEAFPLMARLREKPMPPQAEVISLQFIAISIKLTAGDAGVC
jgi:hypothetical protein